MSFSSETITSGTNLRQRGYDDAWGSEFNAGLNNSTYCAGKNHATVFKINIPTISPTNTYYLTLTFNGVVRTSGSRTLNYGISTYSPTGWSPNSLPPFLAGTTGSVTYSGLTSQNKQLTLNIGSSSSPFISTSTTLYIWIYNTDSTYSMECYSGTSYYNAVIYRQSVGAPSAPTNVTITSTYSTTPLSYIKPTHTVMIRWSGASAGTGGSITGYKIWYRQDNVTTANYIEISSSSSSGSTEISINNYTRGRSLIVSVGTKGTGDLYSDNKRASNSPIINTSPTLTTASFNSNAIISGQEVAINLVGSSGDSGQSVSYEYSETSSSQVRTSINNGDKFKFTHNGNDNASFGRYFYAWDGLEYSSYKYASVTVHSVLSASLTNQQYETSTSLNGTKYLKKGTFKINTNKTTLTSKSITATVDGVTVPIENFSRNNTLLTFTIDFTKLTNIERLSKSKQTIPVIFTINAGTYNGFANSKKVTTNFTTGNSGVGILFNSDNSKTLKNFSLSSNYAKGDLTNELFNNTITLESSEFSDIKSLAYSIIIQRFISFDGSVYTKIKNLDYTSIKDDVSSLQEGVQIKYGVTITDPNGGTYYSETSNTLIKIIKPYIQENIEAGSYIENSSLDTIYYPISGTISENGQTHTTIQIPTTNIYINGIMLSSISNDKPNTWYVKINNEEILTIENVVTDKAGYISLIFNINEILDKAKLTSLDKNSYHNVSLSFSFIDKFGLQSDFYIKQSILKIDFREEPEITEFKIYHSKRRNCDDDYSEVIYGKSSQKVNPEEYIKFSITVTDKNVDNGEESYNNFIYIIKRKDLDIKDGIYTEIARGYLKEVILNESTVGSAIHTIKSASIYNEIKQYKYEIEVIDTSGKSAFKFANLSNSDETNITPTEYDLICFPTNSKPNFNESITLLDKTKGTFQIILNNNLCGYDGYSEWSNLERGEYEKDFKIAVFSDTNYSTILNLSNNSWNEDNTDDKFFTEWKDENENKNIIGYNETITITRAPDKNLTTYYRIGLKISTGLEADGKTNYIYTWSKIYAIDPNNPVVSIRKNYLGINTGSSIDNKNSPILLQINSLSSGDRKIIRLYDPLRKDSDGESIYFEINLSDGSIDGAIIDGGTWTNNLT